MATILIEKLLETAVRHNASDIHLTVGSKPVLRMNTHLIRTETKVLEAEDTVSIMKSITPERIQLEYEQKGSGDFSFQYHEKARFRVAIFKQKGHCAIVLRRIPTTILSLEEIGLPPAVAEICMRPRGLFLVTGPTGSGKTTTLASIINYINVNFD